MYDIVNYCILTRLSPRLTFNASLAELTSLEQLLCILMSQGHIPEQVIDKLWAVYSECLEKMWVFRLLLAQLL